MISPQPKPETRKTARRRVKRGRALWISAVRSVVLRRDAGCRFPESARGEYPCAGPLEMDEFTSRAQRRGRPFGEIFNVENCWMLCREHHRQKTENLWRFAFPHGRDRNVNGPVRFQLAQDVIVGGVSARPFYIELNAIE